MAPASFDFDRLKKSNYRGLTTAVDSGRLQETFMDFVTWLKSNPRAENEQQKEQFLQAVRDFNALLNPPRAWALATMVVPEFRETKGYESGNLGLDRILQIFADRLREPPSEKPLDDESALEWDRNAARIRLLGYGPGGIDEASSSRRSEVEKVVDIWGAAQQNADEIEQYEAWKRREGTSTTTSKSRPFLGPPFSRDREPSSRANPAPRTSRQSMNTTTPPWGTDESTSRPGSARRSGTSAPRHLRKSGDPGLAPYATDRTPSQPKSARSSTSYGGGAATRKTSGGTYGQDLRQTSQALQGVTLRGSLPTTPPRQIRGLSSVRYPPPPLPPVLPQHERVDPDLLPPKDTLEFDGFVEEQERALTIGQRYYNAKKRYDDLPLPIPEAVKQAWNLYGTHVHKEVRKLVAPEIPVRDGRTDYAFKADLTKVYKKNFEELINNSDEDDEDIEFSFRNIYYGYMEVDKSHMVEPELREQFFWWWLIAFYCKQAIKFLDGDD